jgi:RNase P subunit RPR2
MVKAKLHIICGNCGCNDMFKYETKSYFDYDTNRECLEVIIICENCSTIHQLEDNAKKE